MNDKPIFDKIREFKQRWLRKPGLGLSAAEVQEVNQALSDARRSPETPVPALAPIIPGLGFKGPLAAIVGAAAAATLITTVPKEEGWELRAYRDIAGIWTICGGDTKNVRPGMVETEEGCRRRLEAQLVAHASPVMKCTPRLAEPGRDMQRAAAVSLAYNIGVGAYCRSTVDKRFDAGDWKGACDAFLSWNKARVNGVLRPVTGLTNRRKRERDMCLGKELT